MPATLTKIVDGKPAVNDTLENEQFVKCPSCDQVYRLAYSDSEWNRVKDWLSITELVRALDFANVVAELLSKAADSKPISEKSQPMRQFRPLVLCRLEHQRFATSSALGLYAVPIFQ